LKTIMAICYDRLAKETSTFFSGPQPTSFGLAQHGARC
jgi:hypothetical protein